LELFTCALESKLVHWKSASPSSNTFAAIAQHDAVFEFYNDFEAVRQELNGKIFTDGRIEKAMVKLWGVHQLNHDSRVSATAKTLATSECS
jgi:hypothetical protein